MNFQPNLLYHVYNRGNNCQQIFYSREHYLLFIDKIRKILLGQCDLLAYCLMPNHYHLMISAHEIIEGEEFLIPFKHGIKSSEDMNYVWGMDDLVVNFTGFLELMFEVTYLNIHKYGRSAYCECR